MNNTKLFFLLLIFFSSCSRSSQLQKKAYFEFDNVEHYYLSKTSENNLKVIQSKETPSKDEKFMLDLYLGKHDFHLSDSTIILNVIHSMNYNKQTIPIEKNQRLKKIFRDREIKESYDYMCFREYRDVLVFTYKNSIKGIAFICFNCNQNEIIGSDVSTLDFGQKGNYQKLYELLYK